MCLCFRLCTAFFILAAGLCFRLCTAFFILAAGLCLCVFVLFGCPVDNKCSLFFKGRHPFAKCMHLQGQPIEGVEDNPSHGGWRRPWRRRRACFICRLPRHRHLRVLLLHGLGLCRGGWCASSWRRRRGCFICRLPRHLHLRVWLLHGLRLCRGGWCTSWRRRRGCFICRLPKPKHWHLPA